MVTGERMDLQESAESPAVTAEGAHGHGEAVSAPGLSGSRRMLLNSLKVMGSATIPVLAEASGLNVETVRHHLQALSRQGLVERQGTRRSGPGRPEVVYGLTEEAEALFPRREGEILRGLVEH